MNNYKEIVTELFKQKSFTHNPANCVHDLLGNKKIILYGGGDVGMTFLFRVSRKYELNVYAVLDRKFKSGDNFYGIPAFSPTEYTPTKEEKENAVVVVTVGKREYHEEIFNCLRSLGFKNIMLATDIYEYHLINTPVEFEKRGFDYYLDNREQIMACLELFSDDLSREIFIRCIQTHMLRKPIHIPHRALEELMGDNYNSPVTTIKIPV